MGEYAIRARFEFAGEAAALKRWLDHSEGIAGWWSDSVSGAASGVGDEFHVTFPTTDVVFDLVVTESAETLVEWAVPESPPWWRGTTIRFDLEPVADGSGTTLLFTHRGFDPDDPIIPVITPAWVRFLDNLVSVAQSGKAAPAVVN